MSTYSPKAIVGGMRLLLMAGFYAGALYLLMLAGAGFGAHRKIIRDWPLVQARVLSSSMYWDVSRRWGRTPILVTGIEHRLQRLDNNQLGVARTPAGRPNRRGTNPLLRKSLQQFPPGSTMTVRQNPSVPSQMSLVTGYDWNSFYDVGVLFLLAIGSFVFAVWIGKVGLLIQTQIPDGPPTTGAGITS